MLKKYTKTSKFIVEKSSIFLTSRAFLKEKDHQKLFRETDDVMDLTKYLIHNEKNYLLFKVSKNIALKTEIFKSTAEQSFKRRYTTVIINAMVVYADVNNPTSLSFKKLHFSSQLLGKQTKPNLLLVLMPSLIAMI